MTAPDDATTAYAEIEHRAGVRSLDALHAVRDELVAEAAPLGALYGAFGTFDPHRKSRLSEASLRIRATWEGDKLSEARLDTEAHAAPDYVAWLHDATLQRARYIVLLNEIENVGDIIRRDNALLAFRTAEARHAL